MLIPIAAATGLPVTIEQARAYCRAPENGDHDDQIMIALAAAVAFLENQAGVRLAPQTLQYRVDDWPGGTDVEIPAHPVRDIREVAYLGADGIEYLTADADWDWDFTAGGAVLRFVDGFAAPDLKPNRPGRVRITFDAGFDIPGESGSGDDPRLRLPPGAKAAVMMLTKHWYENPEGVASDPQNPIAVGTERLIAQFKVYR